MKCSIATVIKQAALIFALVCTANGSEMTIEINPQPEWLWLMEDQQEPQLRFDDPTPNHQYFNFKAIIPGLYVQKKMVDQEIYSFLG